MKKRFEILHVKWCVFVCLLLGALFTALAVHRNYRTDNLSKDVIVTAEPLNCPALPVGEKSSQKMLVQQLTQEAASRIVYRPIKMSEHRQQLIREYRFIMENLWK